MVDRLEQLVDLARAEARRAGFGSAGVYHLLRAVRLEEPETLSAWLADYGVEEAPFLKFLENVLRPRRAGGGVPRDRIDARLLEQALAEGRALAAADRAPAGTVHLGRALARLDEDPIVSLCERYGLACPGPDRPQG